MGYVCPLAGGGFGYSVREGVEDGNGDGKVEGRSGRLVESCAESFVSHRSSG